MQESLAPLRWGILGTGGIARGFARDLAGVPGAHLAAVGSRTAASARAFAAAVSPSFPDVRAHASWADLVADDDVDAVYVATPHPWHAAGALLAVRAGRHVLVEKPFTMDAQEARDVVAAARAAGVVCLEAMWTRFLPHTLRLRELVASGAIGEVVTVSADHGQWFAQDAAHRLFHPGLGGGALLDLGVYVVSWASMLLGRPSSVLAASATAFTGVDAQTSIVLGYQGPPAQAVLTCTLAAATPRRAFVAGTEGVIDVDPVFYAPTGFTLRRRNGQVERFDTAAGYASSPGKGLREEAAEVARLVAQGKLESPHLPLDESISVMETLDEVRRQIGLTYPGASDRVGARSSHQSPH
ncbi:MAG TPA: Gfo/Idh/MocA family oxidoreductase [Kineosporiaceae bacterium]